MSTDPSKTLTLRREFAQRLRGIWERISAQAFHDITERDVLGLQNSLVNNADPTSIKDLSFETDDSKIEAFKQWLERQVKKGRVEVFTSGGNTYIKSAYQRGMRNADTALRKQGVEIPPDVEIVNEFNKPVHKQQVQQLYTRVLSEWQGIAAAVEQQVGRALADGFAQGEGMYKIAKRIRDRIGSIGKKRATDLARTEIIRASADGALNRYEDFGVDEVAGEAEFLATDDDRVCPICENLDGNIYLIEKAKGMIPQHVRCRCTWAPVVDRPEQLTLDATGNSIARTVA